MISAAQRAKRRLYLGASDIPSLFGVDPYRTENDTYYSKVGPEVDDIASASMTAGNRLESAIVAYAAETLKVEVLEDPAALEWSRGVLLAHPDGLVVGRPEAIEAKLSNPGEEWGAEMTDEVPERIILQVQAQMACNADVQVVWVPVLVQGFRAEFKLYRVPRNGELCEMIHDAASDWWKAHVIAQAPPDPSTPPRLDVLKRMRREPGTVVDLGGDDVVELLNEYTFARAQRLASEKCEAAIQAKVIALLGENEYGALPDGRLLQYPLVKGQRRLVEIERFQAEHPDLYAEFVRQDSYRRLSIKTPKEK